MKSTFNVISDGSSLLDEHRNDAWLIDSESEWLKCKKGCFKIRPPNSSLEVQHTVSAAVILPVISECPHTVILQNWASWVSGRQLGEIKEGDSVLFICSPYIAR